MLNVNAITSTLARMPDAALQKYAALHKEDPYIMALAVSESNRRKQMRSAAQAPQGMPEPPKVVDQDIAEMAPQTQSLPEEQGIARLPTGDMNFAGGGIIAFGDGGDVEHYDGGGGTNYAVAPIGIGGVAIPAYVYKQAADVAARMGTTVPTILKQMGYDVAASAGRGVAGAARVAATAPGAAVLAGGIPATQYATDVMAANPQLRAAYIDNPMLGTMDPNGALAAAILDQASPEKSVAKTTAPAAPVSASAPAPTASSAAPAPTARAPGAGAPRANAPVPAAASAAPAAAGFDMTPEGLAALRNKLGKDINVEEPENLRKAREELTAEDVRAKQEAKDALVRDQAKFADAFKGREERLTKREADLGKQREENTGLAFLNAGLAIMSTPGSLATAIGKGARVGTEQYAAGLDKLRSAQDKLDEARDRMEELKLNRAEMSAKEIREAEAGINAAKVAGKNRGVEALSKMFDVSNKRADTMFTTLAEVGLTQFKEGQANLRNAAEIAGRIQAAGITAGPRENIMSEYTKFIKENPQYLTNEQAGMAAFLRAKAALGGGARMGNTSVSDAPAGTVRP